MPLDLIAGIAIGAFLLAVAAQGNSQKLVDLAKRDKDFVKWAIAVGILYYLYDVPALRPVFGYLIALAFVGLALIAMNNEKFSEQVSSFWNSL